MSPLGDGLLHWSYDFPFKLRPKLELQDVAILYMDEDAHSDLHQSRGEKWHAALQAQLVKALAAQNARAIVFDILFDEPWPADRRVDKDLATLLVEQFRVPTNRLTGAEADRVFAETLQTHTNVVLAASAKKKIEKGEHSMVTLRSPRDILGSNILWGWVEVPEETDGVIRRHSQDWGYTNLAWKVAELVGKAPPERILKRWMNYYGPPMHIPSRSYSEAFRPGASNFIAGKVIFVGKDRNLITPGGTKTGDEFPTPHNAGNSPGVEIQATAYLNLARKDWLEEMSPTIQFLLVVFLGSMFGFGFPLLRP